MQPAWNPDARKKNVTFQGDIESLEKLFIQMQHFERIEPPSPGSQPAQPPHMDLPTDRSNWTTNLGFKNIFLEKQSM